VTPRPTSFSPDGRRLLYYLFGATQVYSLPLQPGQGEDSLPQAGKPEAFPESATYEAAFSADGKWIAYARGLDGTQNPQAAQLFVRSFPDRGGKWQISGAEGGTKPMWSPTGRQLYYTGLDRKIRVVDFSTKGDSFEAGKPRVWADVPLAGPAFSPSADGKRMAVVMNRPGEERAQAQPVVMLHFFDEVQRRMKAGAK
ncbi:MAG: PD40 domain-containing protein, partial [Candidatus Solibacter usitatus]|nr:PD40 domain-containing protein [Candidatus Solibacter usitatus]